MKKEEIDSLLLGADPELVLHKDGKLAPASDYFNGSDEFGCDGCNSVAELRPKPQHTPKGLVSYIAELIDWGHKEFPELKMKAGARGMDYSIGGHIHISTPASPNKIGNLDLLICTLENIIYPSDEMERRKSDGYGKKSEYRRKSYGIEYRVPVSWLTSPTIAMVYLTLAKLAVINDQVNLTEIAEEKSPMEVLTNLKTYLDIVPEDCEEGLEYIPEVIATKETDWGDDLVPHWQEN